MIKSPATLPSRSVAFPAEELGDSTGADSADVVNQTLQVNSCPLVVKLLHGKEDVAHAAHDLGGALLDAISVERVLAPRGVALVGLTLAPPMLTEIRAHVVLHDSFFHPWLHKSDLDDAG